MFEDFVDSVSVEALGVLTADVVKATGRDTGTEQATVTLFAAPFCVSGIDVLEFETGVATALESLFTLGSN